MWRWGWGCREGGEERGRKEGGEMDERREKRREEGVG